MLVTEEDLPVLRKTLYDRKIVFAIGTFDLLHDGHLDYLEWCAQLGDVLVVAVNSDQRTKNRKGPDRPIFAEATRLRIVDSLKMVDYTVLVKDARSAYEAPIKTARLLKPDQIGVGPDQSARYVESWRKAFPSIDVIVNPHPKFVSTSSVINGLLGISTE